MPIEDKAAAARSRLIGAMSENDAKAALAYIAGRSPALFDQAVIGRSERPHDRLPPAGSRFRCSLGIPGHPCTVIARVTITDYLGATARGCLRHAIDALDRNTGAHVDFGDSKGLNEFEVTALRLTDDRNKAQEERRNGS